MTSPMPPAGHHDRRRVVARARRRLRADDLASTVVPSARHEADEHRRCRTAGPGDPSNAENDRPADVDASSRAPRRAGSACPASPRAPILGQDRGRRQRRGCTTRAMTALSVRVRRDMAVDLAASGGASASVHLRAGLGSRASSRSSLSMSRVDPKRTASDASAGPSTVSSSASVSPSATETYSTSASGSRREHVAHRRAERFAGPLARRPTPRAPRAAPAAGPAPRRARSGDRWTLRDDIARPSGSRTVGQVTTSVPIARSRAIWRMTMTCWASFCPKYARSAPTSPNRIATTVATPSKWPGRAAPSSGSGDRARPTRSCRSRAGRPPRPAGAKTRSTPSASQMARSRASLRGYCV